MGQASWAAPEPRLKPPVGQLSGSLPGRSDPRRNGLPIPGAHPISPDDHFDALLSDLAQAPFEPAIWPQALGHVAAMTGSRLGQLWGYHRDVSFNWLSEKGFEAAVEEFAAIGGGDPKVNPRIRIGKRVPLLASVTDEDIAIPPRLKEHNHLYADFYERWDLPHICFALLHASPAGHVGASVLRSRREGPIDLIQRSQFDRVTPHLAAAVRTQAALEQQGAAMAGGAFEALAVAAVLCDAGGRVRALTAAARELIEAEGGLVMQDGLVQASTEARGLRDAIAQVGQWIFQPAGVANREFLLKGRTGMVLADIAPLPRQPWALGTGASVVIILKRQGAGGATLTLSRRAQAALRAAYGLTEAEGQVATLLAQGSTRAEVAAARKVSLETVRVQSRAIFDKCGVGRQTELMALAAQL